jgi:hypothetical protein
MRLMAVAALSLSLGLAQPTAAQVPDHLKCFKVRDQLRQTTYTADLSGLVPEAGCKIRVPAAMICLPSTKTNVSPTPPGGGEGPPAGSFACYRLKCARPELPDVVIDDQFGTRVGTPAFAKMLCAPLNPTTTPTVTVSTTTVTTSTTGPPSTTSTTLPCPYSGPPIYDPNSFTACSPSCGGAHCVPSEIVPSEIQPLLASCTDGLCAPDPIIAAAGQFVPNTCTSIAGAEGRCLSTCLPAVAARAATLPQGGCAADERCMPCFDPTASDPNAPTGACSLACDAPAQPPVLLTCPWTGPDVYNPSVFPACSPSCGGAHCIPAEIVGATSLDLAACPGGFCVPDPIIAAGGNFDPPSCVAFAGTTAAGRCLSTCLPAIAGQPSLEQSSCAAGNRCAPCADPFTGADTGACGSLGCDQPAPTPAFEFPGCCTNLGVCVPKSQIPDASEPDFGQRDCPDTAGDVYLCLDPGQIAGSGVTPTSCTVDFPVPWVSTCVPDCVLGDGAAFLPQGSCPANYSCPPPE